MGACFYSGLEAVWQFSLYLSDRVACRVCTLRIRHSLETEVVDALQSMTSFGGDLEPTIEIFA